MTRFKAVLVRPFDEQTDRDGNLINPAGVEFDPDKDYPIWREFSHDIKDALGHGRVYREGGALMVEGEIDDGLIKIGKLAIGIKVIESIRHRDTYEVRRSEIFAISATHKHSDPAQPLIEPSDAEDPHP